ncbi:MAG: peptidylprolyl isomerase, partial [Planctomycetota bacterium]
RVDVDARIARPDFARLTLRRPGKAPAPDFTFLRSGGTTTVHCSTMKESVPIPAALALKIALLPPDFDRGLPARMQFAPGLASGKAAADMLALGGRCPPVAAYFTEQAARFGRTPPKLAADGTLILPDTDGGRLKITLDADKLPVRVVRQNKSGTTTANFNVKLDAPGDKTELIQVPGLDNAADGFGLLAPALLGLGMPEVAADFADKGVDKYPRSAACRAARGLVRLAAGPPEPGMADLRKAAELSDHPAYALLLAETLIRGRRFAEAKPVCEKAMKTAKPKTEKLEPAEIILGMSLSLRAAFGAMTSGPDDYRRRAAIDCALAHVGLGEHEQAAAAAKKLLATNADDAQAAELLARAQLSLGRPEAALDALAKFDADTSKPQLSTYAALAHHALGDDDKAAAALGAAIKKEPALRNLSFLQQQAAGIHPRFKGAPAKAALARLFSRAVMGVPGPDQKTQLTAIVNDAFVLKADLDALAAQLAGTANLRNVPPEKIRAAALNQTIEDMLVIRWAMWRGITVPDEDVSRAMRDEMTRLGAADIEDYKRLLKERGADFARRPAEIRDNLLKRGAFSVVLSAKILVRPPDVRAAYEKDIGTFKVPPTARLRMITLEFARFREKEEAERLAPALLRRLKAKPESFAELAREYSHDANAERGGLWENVTKSSLIDPLDKIVFGLKPGQTSGVVKTRLGCHIVRVEKIAPERTVPLEQAAANIARSLQEVRSRAEIAAWLERLKAESYIETFGE